MTTYQGDKVQNGVYKSISPRGRSSSRGTEQARNEISGDVMVPTLQTCFRRHVSETLMYQR